jgi:hypothetical protein
MDGRGYHSAAYVVQPGVCAHTLCQEQGWLGSETVFTT